MYKSSGYRLFFVLFFTFNYYEHEKCPLCFHPKKEPDSQNVLKNKIIFNVHKFPEVTPVIILPHSKFSNNSSKTRDLIFNLRVDSNYRQSELRQRTEQLLVLWALLLLSLQQKTSSITTQIVHVSIIQLI